MKNYYNALNSIENEVYFYMFAVKPNGQLMDNSEIAHVVGISEDYLLDVLNSINKKINDSGSYYSD